MSHSFKLGAHTVGASHPPFLIAELSGNHNRSLERALAILDAAARAGAHAVKLQTYTPDTMTLNLAGGEFTITDRGSLWEGRTLYDLYGEANTPWEWHEPIFRRATDLGLVAFSTPFDPTAVEFLEELRVPAYKIASFELVDLPLIRRVAATGKPLFLSTGLATEEEIGEAVVAAREVGGGPIVLLKCTSSYPATAEAANLRTLPALAARFDCQAGLSDHTMGLGTAVAAVALGATVVEKHLTLARSEGGVDSAFSLEPAEFGALAEATLQAWRSLGEVRFGPTDSERKSLQFRRSLYVVRDLPAGGQLTTEDIRAIRPGLGLPPKHLEEVLGRRLSQSVRAGTPLRWDLLE